MTTFMALLFLALVTLAGIVVAALTRPTQSPPQPDYRRIAALEAELGLNPQDPPAEKPKPCPPADHEWVIAESGNGDRDEFCSQCGLTVRKF